ncbi:MAG: hypothetical protein HYV68_00700 [Candidatus Taylorbacteria bacterium]|nr:hypothetical protein [Candidatus Taylorbacteria bacterium]
MKEWLERSRYFDWSIADILAYCRVFVGVSMIELLRHLSEMCECTISRFTFGDD